MQKSVEPRVGKTRLGHGISRMREFDLGPDLRIALGPAAMSAAAKGRTHDRTRPHRTNVTKTLAKGEPSTHDPKATKGLERGDLVWQSGQLQISTEVL